MHISALLVAELYKNHWQVEKYHCISFYLGNKIIYLS